MSSLFQKKGYVKSDITESEVKFVRKTKLGRFFNIFFKEDIIIQYAENEVVVFAKRNMIDPIAMKLKFNR